MQYNVLIKEENIVGGFVVRFFFSFLMFFCTCYYSPTAQY